MHSIESLPLVLKQLNLPSIQLLWEEKQHAALQNNWAYGQYLNVLCNEELAARFQKRVQRYTKESKLPPGKTLATFDFKAAPSINPLQINALADHPDWIKNAENLVIFGPSGVGKTHLAAALGYRAIEHGMRVMFSSTTELVQKLELAKSQFKLPYILNRLSRIPLLILDDIGYVQKSSQETSVLFELIAHRYENTSMIITANQPFSEWNTIFPDDMMTVAAVDRIVHHANIIKIDDKSYRRAHASKKQQSLTQATT